MLSIATSAVAGTGPGIDKASAGHWSLHLQLGHSNLIDSVAFSPNGRILATGSHDNTARLWDVATGRELRVLKGHVSGVTSVAFSPDGRMLATGSHDRTARLWDAATGGALQVLEGHVSGVTSVAFSPDGRTLVTGSGDYTARLWDTATGRELRALDGVNRIFGEVAFSPDGRTLATGSISSDSATLWDVSTGRALRALKGHMANVDSVAFSPDGRTLATGSHGDMTVRLWDVATGRTLRVLDEWHSSDVERVRFNGVAFSPDGRTLATASGLPVDKEPGDDTGSWDKFVRLWDVATGRELRVVKGHSYDVHSVAFSPDGRTLATGSADNTARLWDVATGRELRALEGHSNDVSSVAFSADGRPFATGSSGDSERLWDIATGRALRASEGHSTDVSSVAFSPDASVARSPDGRTRATAEDHTARLWDIATGRRLWILEGHYDGLEGHSEMITSVAFSPDGRMLATGSHDNSARLWDLSNARVLRVLKGHSSAVNSVAFSPDGRTLATGSADNTARLWDVSTGRAPRVLKGHLSAIDGVAFSPDGRTLVSWSGDSTTRLWDIATGRELALVSAFADGSRIALTPEGFFTASEGGARHLYLVRGLDATPLDQVYDALYRPDLVREALAGDPDGKVAAAAAKLDLAKVVSTGLPPQVRALRSLDGDTVDGDTATVAVDIEERDGGLGRIEWRVNGTVQGADSRGLGAAVAAGATAGATAGPGTTRVEKRVFLAPGENTVSVVVYNAADLIASEPVEIALTSTRAAPSKPSLHVLAAGVNDYFDSRLALSYAVPDARALGAALTRAGQGLYETVDVTYLLDEEVSTEGMAAAFAELGAKVRPHDVFAFFLAGHGKTHDGRYYFLPRDFRYRGEDALKDSAISQEQLQGWMAGIPAQKSVLLFDTCESGSLTEEPVTRGLAAQAAIDRLARAVGRTTVTASTDTAPALEGYRGHGLFTYTLLEAFAVADHDADGQIEINELIGHVDERLPALSEAVFGLRQVPQYNSRGSVFALGRPVAVLSEAEEIIPRTPTHVVIAETDVRETRADADSVLDTLGAGVRVRVVESADGWSLVASDGVRLGWLPTSKLLAFQ